MGSSTSRQANPDFNEIKHINKTHVEFAKRLVVSKIYGGFSFFNYINENGGTTHVDYGNGTTAQIHTPQRPWSIFGLGLAFEITIIAVLALILFKLALCAGPSYIKYRNYKHFHSVAIGDEARHKQAAFSVLKKRGPTPASFAAFYHSPDKATERIDTEKGAFFRVPSSGPSNKPDGAKREARSSSDDSTVMKH